MNVEYGLPGGIANGTLVAFEAEMLPWTQAESTYSAVSTSNEPSRDGRVGTLSRVFSNFGQGDANRQAGIWGRHDIGFFGRDSWRYYYNEGLITLPSGILCLPPALTTQAALISSDHSGLNAGNRRVHAIMFSNRAVFFVNNNMIHDTSTSNPALTVPATADNISDDVLSTWIGTVNGTENCLIIGTDGQTDDAKYATALADTMSWTSLVTYANSADRIWWGGYFQELGNGWHIFGGKINNVAGIYAFKSSDAPPLTISTLAPVVFADTRDIEGNIATVTTSAVSPGSGVPNVGTGDTSEPSHIEDADATAWWTGWSNAGNVTADDGSYATATASFRVESDGSTTRETPEGIITDEHQSVNYDFTAVPRSAIITGVQAPIRAFESNANDAISWALVQLAVNGNKVGENRADATELDTDPGTDPTKTFGGTTDRWGTNLRGEDVRSGLSLITQFKADEGNSSNSGTVSTNTGTISLGHTPLTLTYRVPGTQIDCVQGGFTIGPIPNEPNTMPVIEPVVDDETAITVRRVYKEYTFEYDADGDRPVGSITTPPINLNYCGLMAHFQGGVAIAGGADESTWNEIRWRRADRQVINLRFPKFHGANAQTITHMRGNGEFLWVWVCDTDNGDAQLWLYHDGEWHVQGVLQSKSNTIASRPLYWAETTHGAYQEVEVNFFPVADTALAAARQKVAKNPLIDPHLDMASVTKHDGPLALTTPELAWVPPELSSAITTLELQTHRVDDNTSYGSVRVKIDTGGDFAFSSAEVDQTFDAAAEAFTQRNLVTATGNPGVSVPTGILQIILDNQNTSAETPQGLPLVFTLETAWQGMREFTFRINANSAYKPLDILNTVGRLETLRRTKPTQRLYVHVEPFISNNGLPALYVGHQVVFNTTDRARHTVDDIQYVDVTFRECPGGLS